MLKEVIAGGARVQRLVFTRNRTVMASMANGGRTLRLHEAFAAAPPDVLRSLGCLLAPGTKGAERTRLRKVVSHFLETAISRHPNRPGRRARPLSDPTDVPHLERLRREFDEVNARFFRSKLPVVPIRLSDRLRRRNGHFRTNPLEITIARKLCTDGVDGEAEHTLRHEMIHLWQWLTGAKLGHGGDFRRMARVVDVHPRASRPVRWRSEGTGAVGG